ANSVLKNGNWYNLSISSTGVYKVSYEDLASLGVSSAIPSSQLSIWGNGGGMLPEKAGSKKFDDLVENPIEVFDGGDGQFGPGDYFIFYGKGPHLWNFSGGKFSHTYNIYSDVAFYFVNVDGVGEGKRIQQQDNSSLVSTQTVTSYTYHTYTEQDVKNFGEAGKLWVGDIFDVTTTRSYEFSVPNLLQKPIRLTFAAAAVSSQSSNFSIAIGSQSIGSLSLQKAGSNYASTASKDFSFTPSSQNSSLSVTLTYNKPTASSAGYLDYIELVAECALKMNKGQFSFRNSDAVGAGGTAEFHLSGASSSVKIWDVTDIASVQNIAGTLSDGTLVFKSEMNQLREFVAFDGTSFYSVKPIGKVANQDLHGTSDVDMIIVAHPNFISQANRLAQFRTENDGLSVKVVTPQQIYNEFSSGAQDVSAIRDYMKMIYDKSAVHPKYLLLFGRPSYDYRGRMESNGLYVPNYQLDASLSENSLRSNDDYFALLDDGEGENGNGLLDLGVGRFPVTSSSQAQIVVDKTITYSKKKNLVETSNHSAVSNFADWKNVVALVADDEDNAHIVAAESAAKIVEANNKNINLDKIYLDAFQQVSSAGTQSYPDVNTAIDLRMNKGSLAFMYVGHSGVKGWAHERILDFQMINSWTNKYNQPLLLVMGCEFARYDRSVLSPADRILINSKGGAVAVVSTSRVAFSGSNQTYGDNYFKKLFVKENNQYPTIGELNRIAKNAYGGMTGGNLNGIAMIITLGDPALRLAFPEFVVHTDSINGQMVTALSDTMKALSKVTISGSVVDENGSLMSDFNGNLFPTVFDKKMKSATLQNDEESPYLEFDVQKNVIFKGNCSVKNGKFSFSFVVPKDINFSYGNGRISYYARSSSKDATGFFDEMIVGGQDTAAINDSQGPEMDLYLNDENFVNGGMTDENPTLIVKLKDDYGINTTGNGIGHDLVAILDDETDNQIVLNDYYVTEQDSFNTGTVRYPYKKLSLGDHKLKVRAWDILNNVSEQTLSFTVVSDAKLTLDHILNYPNPFTTNTDFYFEHNRPGVSLDILIQIFTVSGKLVRTLESTQTTEGTRCMPIHWDGRDDFGDRLGKGTYIYRLRVRDANGDLSEKFEKLVIL
ncbi:MAG: type IX secretion system sortase PorU, partial [Bacteroidales bacterium]|nr:type IX secretion system sortase PorU [Bacteroidales bacterium]